MPETKSKKVANAKPEAPTEPKPKKQKAVKTDYVYALEPLPEKRHPWASEPEVGELIASIIKLHGAVNVLELGVLTGSTSKYIIDALPENGSFVGVDIEDLRSDSFKAATENDSRVKFVLGSSLDVTKSMPLKHFDLIYIDTVHEWAFALSEFKIVERLINPKGVLVYHDTIKFEGMARLVKYAQSFRYNAVTFNTPEANGLTLIQR